MLGYIYWHNATKSSHETAFIAATTAGCIVGMILFGICCDKFGRRKMYGYDTILLMIGSVGVVMSSTGYTPRGQADLGDPGAIDYGSFGSMNIHAWLLFWRFITGIGVGGDYPCSSVIVSEFAPTSKRPQMLAMVFSMQSFGNAAAALVSFLVTVVVEARHPYNSADPEASARAVDQIWRWVIGLGLIPASLTAVMRFTIPESPRYTLDVLNDPLKAYKETERLKRSSFGSETIDLSNSAAPVQHLLFNNEDEEAHTISSTAKENHVDDQQTPTIRQYFWNEGNWRYLLVTSLIWFLVDAGTNALGLNQAQLLSKFWYGRKVKVMAPKVWNSNTVDPNASIYSILKSNSIHLLAITSAPSIVGSLLIVFSIAHMNRRRLTWVMFIVNGVLFVVTGATLLKSSDTSWGFTIMFYALSNLALVFGVGPLTFLIPAELFPTKYRTSCYGLSAASGKIGTILGSVLLRYVTFGDGKSKVTPGSSPSAWLAYVLIVSAAPLFLGGIFSWLWIPELQESSGKSRTLEKLAEGRKSAVLDRGQRF
jgi:PHS family inorganic phosphate transporter-like MFS transporter